MTLTVYDKSTLRQLNSAATSQSSCGGGGGGASWQYAVPQVVTNTSGCPVIGLLVASFETDVIRVDRRRHWPLLYIGMSYSKQTAVDRGSRSDRPRPC